MFGNILKRLGFGKASKSPSNDKNSADEYLMERNSNIPSSPDEIRFGVGDAANDIILSKVTIFDNANHKEIFTTPEQSKFFSNFGSQLFSAGTNAGLLANGVHGLYRATVSPSQLMQYTNGTVSSIVREGGKVSQHAGFVSASSASIFTPMLLFQISSIITGQYYLNGINKQLSEISKKLDLIVQKIDDDKKGRIFSAIEIRNLMAEQKSFTVDDLVRLRSAQDSVLSIYHYYLLQMERTKETIKWEKDKWKTVNDVKTTESNIRNSNFYDQLAMAAQAYDLYTTFEIIYFKMCLYMTKYDISYSDKVLSLVEHFQNYNKGYLKHKEILKDFEGMLTTYLENRLNHADFNLDAIRGISDKLLKEAKEKNSLFDEQARIRAVTNNLEKAVTQQHSLYIDADGETTRLFIENVDNKSVSS